MQLFAILLVAVAMLTVLSGVSICAGTTDKERSSAAWFLFACLGASLWAVAIAVFLCLPTTATDTAPAWVAGIFTGSVLMDIGLLGYSGWRYKSGKILTCLFAVLGCALIGVLYAKPELLYSGISLQHEGNMIYFMNDWYFWIYGSFIGVITMIFSAFLLVKIINTKSKKGRLGHLLFLGGLSLTGGLSLIFDLIIPIAVPRCDLLWVGPLAIGITILAFYYTILHYRILALNVHWLKTLSFVILIISAIIAYLTIFFALFSALFRTTTPSIEVLLLNFLMAIIVLLLLPTFTEVYHSAKSRMATQQIDVGYIIKKVSKVNPKRENLKDLAGFLADHLHFTYVGFLINGRLYGSSSLAFTADELAKISKMKSRDGGLWQKTDETTGKILNNLDINAVAELRDAKGNTFGQFIFGKPLSKAKFERRDLVQLEMIINLVATVLD